MTSVENKIEDLIIDNHKLRRSLRPTNQLLGGLGAIILVVFVAGAAKVATRKNADFDIVTARQVRIVDEDGKVKVLLAGGKQTSPSIVQGYVAVIDDAGNGSSIFGH